MASSVKTIIYPVADLPTATGIFRALLGAEPVMDQPYYVQFAAHGQDIGLDPNGHRAGMTAPVCYFEVDDIAAVVSDLLASGATEQQAVHNVGGGKLIATLRDQDGNPIGLAQTPA